MRASTLMLVLALAAGSARADEKGTYFGGVRKLGPRQYLDLDNGGVFESAKPFPGGETEVRQYRILVPSVKDPAMADAAPRWSRSPWHRVTTNKGNTAWVQFLRPDGITVLRFITRLGGKGGPLPAPKGVFCLGNGGAIEVHFQADAIYARYRIERRAPGDEEFKTVGTTLAPPFRDAKVDGGSRYAYRIAGVTGDGRIGIPITLAGTTESRGVLSGRALLDRRANKSFDFVRGIVVPDGGDITLQGTYGGRSSAAFRDFAGQMVRPLQPATGNPLSAWDHHTRGGSMIESGRTFLVPLRDGGVARCRLTLPEKRPNGPEAILEYDAYPDGPVLPVGATIQAKRADRGVEVSIKVPEGHRVTKVEVRETLSGEGPWELEVKRGVAFDVNAKDGELREYVALAEDKHGRRSLPARTSLSLLGNQIVRGEFKFHYKQGFSFQLQRIVPAKEADVYFRTCAGGISSITLSASGGIINLNHALGDLGQDVTVKSLFHSIVSTQAGQLRLKPEAQGNRHAPSSDVFILKTRHGGWAKLAIIHRGDKGGWTDYLATVKFVYNPVEPVFEHNRGQGEQRNGIAMVGVKGVEDRARILRGWREGWGRLWANAGRPAVAGGAIPDPAKRQEVLLSRRLHRSYDKATFSFGHAVRDDPGMAKVRNDWDLLYDGKQFRVRTVTDDRSTIRDLGKTTWNDLQRVQELKEPWELIATPRFGHVYLIHTVDKDTNYFTLVRVSGIKPGDQVAFEWVSLQPKGITTSPGLNPAPALTQRVERLLKALPKTENDRKQAFAGREAEYATLKRLREQQFPIGVQRETAKSLLKALEAVCDVRIVLPDGVVPPLVDIVHRKISAAAMLDELARQTKLSWRVQQDGIIRFSR